MPQQYTSFHQTGPWEQGLRELTIHAYLPWSCDSGNVARSAYMTAATTIRIVMWMPLSLTLSEFQETKYMTTKAHAYGGTVMRFAVEPL